MDRLGNNGFTLIEMMVTIAIMAILLSIAVPSYQSVTTSMRMTNEINALAADINFARSEAVKRGLNISVCPPSGGACSTGSNLSWAGGWVVFDLNPTTAVQLRVSSGVTHGDALNGAAPITFTPAGYTQFANTITLHTGNDDISQRRCVVFATGSWTVKSGANCP
jgi:type IV fimbrial biogenesis protein FimT